MPRYIDADKLVDEIEEEIEAGNEEIYEEDNLINKGLKIALKDIKNQPTVDAATIIQSGWISVKDKMPETGVYVLAVCEVSKIGGSKGYYICDAFYTSKFSHFARNCDDVEWDYNEENDEYYFPEGWWEVIRNWADYGYVAIQDKVVYWMPLSALSKEE